MLCLIINSEWTQELSISKSLKCSRSEELHKTHMSFVGISCSLFITLCISEILICYLSVGENNIFVYICKARLRWSRMRIYCLPSTGNSITLLQIFLEQLLHVLHYDYTYTRISIEWNCKIHTFMYIPTHTCARTHKHTHVHSPQPTNHQIQHRTIAKVTERVIEPF